MPTVSPPIVPELGGLARGQVESMLAAGAEIGECYRVLGKAGLNVVGEVLRGQGDFIEYDHYPHDDVFDSETFSQYYYHAHRGLRGEHGHFHTFLRHGGFAPGVEPMPNMGAEPWPAGDEALAHLIGISMNREGFPVGLFAVNRWVVGDTWFRAADVIGMLDGFAIDHPLPSWPVNRWITAMLRLFRPHIEALLLHREATIALWASSHPDRDVLEDRELEVTGYLPVSVEETILALRETLRRSAALTPLGRPRHRLRL